MRRAALGCEWVRALNRHLSRCRKLNAATRDEPIGRQQRCQAKICHAFDLEQTKNQGLTHYSDFPKKARLQLCTVMDETTSNECSVPVLVLQRLRRPLCGAAFSLSNGDDPLARSERLSGLKKKIAWKVRHLKICSLLQCNLANGAAICGARAH